MKAIKQTSAQWLWMCSRPQHHAMHPGSRPEVATRDVLLAKDFEWKPPMPFNPHPELQAVEIEPGVFLIDDTMIPDTPEQAAARKQWEEADALAKAIAADPLLAAAAKQAAAEAERVAKEALQKRIHEEFVPWLHVEAKLADGTQTTFARQLQDRLAETKNEIARLAAQNAAELEAGREQAAAIGLMDMGTNQLGGVLSLVGTGDGLGFITSFNTEAADTISTDELQPGGNTSLALTGTNTVIGVWEAGRVFTNHLNSPTVDGECLNWKQQTATASRTTRHMSPAHWLAGV